MSERCDWPHCRLPYASTMHADNKVFRLCDTHSEMVQDEDNVRMKRARKKLGMALPGRINGYIPAGGSVEAGARCAYKDCGYPMSLVIYTPTFPKEVGGVPACNSHYRKIQDEDIEWDGAQYWRRFITSCSLDDDPLFDEDKSKKPKDKTLVEVFEEEEPTEEDLGLAQSLMERLAGGAFDAPED